MMLTDLLPSDPSNISDEEIYEAFGRWVSDRGITLYPAQDEASLNLVAGNNVILATPTGSGKSLVAIAAHFYAMCRDQVSFYTAPIKALVSEKFFDLCKIFGAENVGMVTGDSAVNADAPIICCTAEILANIALREGSQADVSTVIMDEFHFYADPQRGWAWQVPLIELPQAQFLLMSATLGDVSRFEKELTDRTGRETTTVAHTDRPIPLHFYYSMEPVQEAVDELIRTTQTPIYIVHFSQLDAIDRATGLMSINVATKEEKERISELIGGFRFAAGFGKTLNRLVRHGIGVHHAGMLPKYRRLVEQLAQAGLLKVICGTDTLGVGINVPIRTVVITALSKYDGTRTRILNAREFHQIAGRAGRAGFDTAGTVLVQAPEHAIENAKAMEKAVKKHGEGSTKLRQIPKKKPPQGFVTWGEKTYEKIVDASPETLKSSFQVSHSMILNLLEREENTFQTISRLLNENHETPTAQRKLKLRVLGILRELLATGVVVRNAEPDRYGNHYALTVHLQQNFALNQPLSPFALAALELFEPDSASYALDVVSVIEATLEKPRQVLSAQEKKVRGEAVAQMKADGIEYDQRMNILDTITYPQPLAERLESAFEQYRQGAPWLADFELAPKSVVRDMYERAMGFSDFVQYYNLARSEGVLLRYLTDAYKALRQTVPQDSLREDLIDLIEWLGEMIRQIDSSLLDEWEELSRGEMPEDHQGEITPPAPEKLTTNQRAFRVMVRNEMFRRVKLFADEQDQALGELDGHNGFDADAWAQVMDDYFEEHEDIDDGPTARSTKLFILTEKPDRIWQVRQIFADPEENHDWGINATISLDDSDEAGFPVVSLTSVGRLD